MSQRDMLNSNVVSHIMQARDGALLARLTQLPVGQVVISSIMLAELEYGLHRKGQPARLRNALIQGQPCDKAFAQVPEGLLHRLKLEVW